MRIEDFEGRLIGDLAGMRVVTPQDIMYPGGMCLPF